MDTIFSKLKSTEQYAHLLEFSVKIRGGDIQQMLRSLVSSGFAQAVSFWSVDENLHVHSPLTCNRPQRNILRFQNMMWRDAQGPIACRQEQLQGITVEAANHFSLEYTQRLAMEGLRPCYNLYLRNQGSLAGGAMVILFLPLNFPQTAMQSPELLECLQYLMEQEYQMLLKQKQLDLNTDVLLQIIDRNNVGLAVFSWKGKKTIHYSNALFLSHCAGIVNCTDRDSALDQLLLKAFNLRQAPGFQFKGMDLVISGQDGRMFNLLLSGHRMASESAAYILILSPAPAQNTSSIQPPSSLTEREKNVVFLIVRGKRNREIAQELNISIPTVKKHVQSIFQKLSVPNRAALVARLYEESESSTGEGI